MIKTGIIKFAADSPVRRSVTVLVPYARNSRTHSADQISQIAASIREWGFTNPVLIDSDNGIIAGHGRVMAAQLLGLAEVPCIIADGWTDTQKRAYIIADNRLALNASWDNDMLAVEFEALEDAGFDIGMTGFTNEEIAALLHTEEEGLTDPDDVPQEPVTPVTVLGDIWILGDHRIRCGDSTNANDVAALLGDVKPHLMVTDPPYGVEYDANWRDEAGINKKHQKRATGKVLNDDKCDWREAWALFPGNIAYVWHGGKHAGEVQESLEFCDFEIRSQIIWAKSVLVMSRGDYHWQHEPCWYAVKGTGNWKGDRKQTTLWQIPSMSKANGKVDDGKTDHSTQKPVECMKRPMENNSSPGQAIYEPFSGSGTTIIAGEMTGRHIYAMELFPQYVDMAVIRWQNFTGKKAIHIDGREFTVAA